MSEKILICTIMVRIVMVVSISEVNTEGLHAAVDKFQKSVQQQTFQTIIQSIEQRLRNLDNIYSMQLSETLQSKLDQYQRKLESLDTKIIRLESMVMMNLDRISENISTKNYKDEVARVHSYRRLDNVYDGLSHRMNYLERKVEGAFEKVQSKLDSTLNRLEKMEEDMIQRNTDIEAELSETTSILEEYKRSSVSTDVELLNMTNILKETLSHAPETLNRSMVRLIENLNQSMIDHLEKINITLFKASEQTKNIDSSIKREIKGDLNAYANKVADMNSEIWKRNDAMDESMKRMEIVGNSTRNEMQNGIRALMLQIGKASGKGSMYNDKASLESLRKSVNLSLEKIMSNQELFLESCHRVQMDESQIESEISVMLGKLIDMLETKMSTVMKDLKSIEKGLKSQDARINRNLNQANTNIISLFEKTARSEGSTEKQLGDIKSSLNSLFTFIQNVLPSRETNITESFLNDLSLNLSKVIRLINSSHIEKAIKWNQLESHFIKHKQGTDRIENQLNNATEAVLSDNLKHYKHLSDNMQRSFAEIKITFNDLQKCVKAEQNVSTLGALIDNDLKINNAAKNCSENSGDLIDIRSGGLACNNTNFTDAIQPLTAEKQLNVSILEVFGTPPPPQEMQNRRDSSTQKVKCPPKWASSIDVRFSNDNCTNKAVRKRKNKRKQGKKKLYFRFGDEEGQTTEDTTENTDDYEESTTSEQSTEYATEITSLEPGTEINGTTKPN